MDFSSKSKEELALELERLERKYDSLKKSHDSYVNDYKQSENTLRNAEERFRHAFEYSAIGIWFVQTNGRIIKVNKAVEEMLGYKSEELKNLSFNDITYPDDASIGTSFLKKMLANEIETGSFEKRYIRKDGKVIYAITTVSLINKDKEDKFFFTQTNDITTRRQAELELKLSKEKYSRIFDLAPVLISLEDLGTGKCIDVNDFAFTFSGFSREEIIGRSFTEIGWTSKESNQTLITILNENGRIDGLELPFIAKTGTQLHGLVNGEKIIINDKEFLLTITTDISARKQLELLLQNKTKEIENQNIELKNAKEKAEESEFKFKAAFYTSPDSININKLDGTYVEINEGFTLLTGYSREDVIGKLSSEIKIWAKPEDRVKLIDGLKEFGLVENLESVYRRKNGLLIPALMSAKIIRLNNEPHILSVTRDISERKKNEQELIKAKEKAEESDKLKTAFLQNMSHEIRTPMNAIMGFSELLVYNYGNKSKLEQFSNIINQRCNDLLIIIDDILDIAKIESGQLTLNIEKCHINSLFDELKTFFTEQQQKLNKQHVKLILQAQCKDSNLVIETDKVKIKQIFINLIGNAFKFTEKGTIEGGCTIDSNNIIFYVSDTGIGILAEQQKQIFERFIQINHVPGRLYSGTGLGLSIVKGLIELLGGKIWLHSEIGKGSTFYFSLPYKS